MHKIFAPFYGELTIFFPAISTLILNILVTILQHFKLIFQNTPTFSISEGFESSNGHLNKSTLFLDPL